MSNIEDGIMGLIDSYVELKIEQEIKPILFYDSGHGHDLKIVRNTIKSKLEKVGLTQLNLNKKSQPTVGLTGALKKIGGTMNSNKKPGRVQRPVETVVSGRLYVGQTISIRNEAQEITMAEHDFKNHWSIFCTDKYKIKQTHENKIVSIEAR